jgi:capsular exopolysaccharide synthesis family protein
MVRSEYDRGPEREETGGVVPFRRAQGGLQVVGDVRDAGESRPDGANQFWSVLQTLLRRRWLILAVLLAGLSASAAFTLTKVPRYRASASLEVQRQETQILEGKDVQPVTIADAEHMATQYALLRSRALAERVAEVLDLPSDERFANQELPRSDRLNQAVGVVAEGLEVLPVSRSRVIEVRYSSDYPQETARIANAVAENFIEMNLERRYNATAYARNFLEERLATTKAALEDAERKLIAYSREQEIVDLSSVGGSEMGSSLDASSLVALNSALTEAQSERIAAEQRYNEAKSSEVVKELLESPTVQRLRERRSELSAEYEQKRSRFKEDYPDMRELAAQIAAIDKDLARERTSVVASLEAEYRSAVAREAALQTRVDELKGTVQDLRGRSVDYNILSREVDTLRGQYDALLQRFKEVSVASGIGSSQVSIVDRAQAPKLPFEPNLRLELIRALALSLVAAYGLALLLEYIDDTIKTPDDIKDKLGLPVIGVIPKLKGNIRVEDQLRDPASPITESFSSARTALLYATSKGAPRTLLVTGVRPSEGKTSTSLAVGSLLASMGRRVLIIDADLRRPSFASAPGASAGLSGCLTADIALDRHVIAGSVENLYLLPSGVIPPNPAELLATPRMAHLLSTAAETFDHVIVDSPPVLDFADAPTLSALCEATMLVMQAGTIRRPVAVRTVNRLLDARAMLIGAVLTKYDVRRTGYSYGYSYSYSYGGYGQKALSSEAGRRRRIEIFNPDGGPDADTRSA